MKYVIICDPLLISGMSFVKKIGKLRICFSFIKPMDIKMFEFLFLLCFLEDKYAMKV